MSAHNIEFEDNSYDVVQHIDGLEHIPVEWEYDVLKEEVRVAKNYIFHANAMDTASLDVIANSNGFTNVHINIKSEEQWDDFYGCYRSDFNYSRVFKEIWNGTYYIVLKKNNGS